MHFRVEHMDGKNSNCKSLKAGFTFLASRDQKSLMGDMLQHEILSLWQDSIREGLTGHPQRLGYYPKYNRKPLGSSESKRMI